MNSLLTARRRATGGSLPNPVGGGGLPPVGTFTRLSTLGLVAGDEPDLSGYTFMNDMESMPNLGYVTCNTGKIIHDPTKAVVWNAKGIYLGPSAEWDTWDNDTTPRTKRLTINLTGARPAGLIEGLSHTDNTPRYNPFETNDNGMLRGFVAMGAKFRSHSVTRTNQWALADHVEAGQAQATLDASDGQPIYLFAGDRMIFTPTHYGDPGKRTEVMTVAANTNGSNVVTFTTNFAYFHWGRWQYVVDGVGLSYADGPFTIGEGRSWTNGIAYNTKLRTHVDQTNGIDMRGRVGLLDCGQIYWTCPQDSDLSTYGWGTSIMMMGSAPQANFQFIGNVLEDYGQLARVGAYGFHCHNQSWDVRFAGIGGTNQYNGQLPSSCVVKNNGFVKGHNRGVVIHNTDGLLVQSNVIHNAVGSAVDMEDATERKNMIWDNLIARVSAPPAGKAIKTRDYVLLNGENNDRVVFGPTGIWQQNLDNYIQRNRIYDSDATGWWTSNSKGTLTRDGRPGTCFGDAKNVPMFPNLFPPTSATFGNVCQSNMKQQRQQRYPIANEQQSQIDYGDKPIFYVDGDSTKAAVVPEFGPFEMYSGNSGYENAISTPRYVGWKQADIKFEGIFGVTDAKISLPSRGIEHMIAIGSSLLNQGYTGYQTPTTSYHDTESNIDMTVINYPDRAPTLQGSGNLKGVIFTNAQGNADLYIDGLFRGFYANKGWKFWNVRPVARSPLNIPMMIDGFAFLNGTSFKASVDARTNDAQRGGSGDIEDPYNYCGYGENAHVIYNYPHWTYGAGTVTPDPVLSQQAYTLTPFVGIEIGSDTSNQYESVYDRVRQIWERLDPADQSVVANATLDIFHNSNDGQAKFCIDSVPMGGWISFRSPDRAAPSAFFRVRFRGVDRGSSGIYFRHPWSGSVAPKMNIGLDQYPVGNGVDTVGVEKSSIALLKASTTNAFYRDTANNRLILKILPIGTVDYDKGGPENASRTLVTISPA